MAGEKRKRRTLADAKREAINEVLAYLEYRSALCRDGLERAVRQGGETCRGAATERSAKWEVEIIDRDVRTILAAQGDRGERRRELSANLAKWAEYVAEHPTPTPQTGEGKR